MYEGEKSAVPLRFYNFWRLNAAYVRLYSYLAIISRRLLSGAFHRSVVLRQLSVGDRRFLSHLFPLLLPVIAFIILYSAAGFL